MSDSIPDVKKVGALLLEIGGLLMSSGASSERIRITTNRIAEAFGYSCDLLITHRALMISVNSNNSNEFFSSLKRTSPHGVNFTVVSGISKMSWKIVEENWSIELIKEEMARLKSISAYPRWLTLVLVGLAGSAFCFLFGGAGLEMAVTFTATVAGLYVRQESHKLKFNPYLNVFFGSVTASMISGLLSKFDWGTNPETAFATSVLFLIPGVPLINSFTDLMDGNIMNGVIRGFNGLMIALAIALGMLVSLMIYQM
ncbi:threonine/serine exporter [bacterium]|nr:MAG: threonine/serine exporter [bacterium]